MTTSTSLSPWQGSGFDFARRVQFRGIMLRNHQIELFSIENMRRRLLALSRNREIFLSSSTAWRRIHRKRRRILRVSLAMIIFPTSIDCRRKCVWKKREKVHSSAANENLQNLFLHVWLKWAELKYNLQLKPKKAFSFEEKHLSIVSGCWMNMIQLKFFSLSFIFLLTENNCVNCGFLI